ncbi:hypothetical protein GTY78_06455 [Streptomyces sp. SID4934]|uniref:WD40 repeat domain-containing protein n=1 Tax=unclassified Streptomyces TaxID=2593676 RepID=UPI00081ED429|nr:WD40 repeat domain-containing protein [Streptomyces sp. ScaeMP-6W]MYQ70689.1 hypothetical protein [Streptomyces sp. SID4934]SCD56237.1 WD40 repeat [Streptomyces sp. ScaeMP-6W]
MTATAHAAVLDRLLGMLSTGAWATASPYLRRHAIEHAVEAGRADELLVDADFLVYADPYTLAPALDTGRSSAAVAAVAVYRASLGIHRFLTPDARRRLLALDAVGYRLDGLAGALAEGLPAETLRPRWRTGSALNSALRDSSSGAGRSVAAITGAVVAGRPVLAAGSWNGRVNVWDLPTGRFVGRPLWGHDEVVNRIACVRSEGHCLAVSTEFSGAIQVWDLDDGTHVGQLPVAYSVPDVACTQVNGEPVAVTGGLSDDAVRVWSLRTLEQLGDPLPGGVSALACLTMDGEPMVVTAGSRTGGGLRCWNLRTREPWGDPLPCLPNVGVISCIEHLGRPLVVAGGGRALQIFDLCSGTLTHDLSTAHDDAVYAVDCVHVGGVPVAVTGSRDLTVRVWDLLTGKPFGAPLGRHSNDVIGVACAVIDGIAVAASSDRYGFMRVWTLGAGPVGSPVTGHAVQMLRTVRVVAHGRFDGTPVALSGGGDGTLRVWDLATGRQIDRTVNGGRWGIDALAVIDIDEEPHVLGTGLRHRLTAGLPEQQALSPDSGGAGFESLALSQMDGRSIAVTSGRSGHIHFTDLVSGAVRSATTDADTVKAVCCTVVAETATAVTCHANGEIRLWDVVAAQQIGAPLTGHTQAATAVACTVLNGTPVAVTASEDATLRVWDLLRRQQSGPPLIGHTRAVNTVACAQYDGRTLAFSSGDDGALRTWDLALGRCVDEWPVARIVTALTVVPGTPGSLIVGIGDEVAVFDVPRRLTGPSSNGSGR